MSLPDSDVSGPRGRNIPGVFLAQGFERGLRITKRLDIASLKKLWSWDTEGLTLCEGDSMSPWCCPLRMGGRKGCQNDRTQAGEILAGSALEGHLAQTQGSEVGFT